MSEAGWAERKVNRKPMAVGCKSVSAQAAITLLLAEHKRAARVVEREIERVKKDQHTYHSEERCLILGSLETVLKALQKGRT